jgi:hypothetical protein
MEEGWREASILVVKRGMSVLACEVGHSGLYLGSLVRADSKHDAKGVMWNIEEEEGANDQMAGS